MKKTSALFAILIAFMFIAGCTQHLGNFTVLSSANFEPKNIDANHLKKTNAEGRTQSIIIFGFPLGGQPKIDQAVAEALKSEGGDVMTNASLYSFQWYFLIIGSMGYDVKGDVYRTR